MAHYLESSWDRASKTMSKDADKLEVALKNPRFVREFIAFAEEAPLAALITTCASADSQTLRSREHAIDLAIAVQLNCCTAAIEVDWVEASHALHQTIACRPRTLDSERSVAIVFTALAKSYGRAERAHLKGTEHLATDPSWNAPSEDLLLKQMPAGYHPTLLPSLIEEALKAGASNEFLSHCIRALFDEAWWPSWRASLLLRNDLHETLRSLARSQISEGAIRNREAVTHLRVFAGF
jgi:hypothetical protein